MKYIKLFENFITPPDIENTMIFFHGGNLDEFKDTIINKKGRFRFGVGLYATERLESAREYAKGNRKLYMLNIEIGNDIHNSLLNKNDCIDFVKSNIITTKRNLMLSSLEEHYKDDKIKAYIFNNLIITHECIKPTKTNELREFFVNNNIDYEIQNGTFGFPDNMIVLFNMKKIKNIIRIMPKDVVKLEK
jgi:hypothetical protein